MFDVIAGLDPAISILSAWRCHVNRDARDKRGHDESLLIYAEDGLRRLATGHAVELLQRIGRQIEFGRDEIFPQVCER